MSVESRVLGKGTKVAGCLFLALQLSLAQTTAHKPVTSSAENTRAILVEKGHALEARGRPDMAIQLWQQILLSDPNNPEALAGLARDLKLVGSDKAPEALDRLRKANPSDPNISKIEGLASTHDENAKLRQAGDLARQGKVDDAMRIYKQLYGDHPPDGDVALAYYQTLYGTANGKPDALAGMRALSERNPGDPRFAVELGIMLTYEQKSRAEGIRILREHVKETGAQAALRQALVWDSDNPASAAELREYLKEHPQDTDLANRLKEDEGKIAQMNSGIARTPAERAAFAALNAKRLDEAEKRFTDLLTEDPHNGRAAAGMGFLRMQQNNFAGAISFLAQAESNGYKARSVEDGLATSRFWYTMGEASEAFDQNQFDIAASKYQQALTMRPHSAEAITGIAGLLTKQQQYTAAAGYFDQLTKIRPGSVDGWRGLFLAYARDHQDQKALAAEARFPAAVKIALTKDLEYLQALATLYTNENRPADAQRVLAQAMALPFPDNGATLKAGTKLQYAGLLTEAKHYDQAINLYTQMLTDDPANLSAWMGIVSAHHELGQDIEAIQDVQKMPPATYESALGDAGFLSMLGAMYQQANQLEVAQGLLERSAKLQTAAGGQPSVALELQLAAVYLQRNETDQAYGMYHQVLAAYPDRVDAWRGLIAALQVTHRDNEAIEEIAAIPAAVRNKLDADIEFEQSEASLYAAAGDYPHAIDYMNRVQAHYARLRTPEPATIEIQNAWLLFNTKNDRQLYPALMRLGSRADLTVAQRETIEDIWANWSVRRASAAMENGYGQRAIDILDAASQAFPNNIAVRKAVAGGYSQVGRSKESLNLYKVIPMQDASAGDFQGAIGAALAANDKGQAEQWLRQALERFPRDPSILTLAARYEQARGDNQRAADFYRASLAAMPSASPAEKLAHVLVYPDQDTRTRRVVTAADLQHLLDPDYEPFAKTAKIPPLPAYGADPYNGSAPVVIAPRRQAAQAPAEQHPDPSPELDLPQLSPSSSTQAPQQSTPVYVPQAWHRPLRRGAEGNSSSLVRPGLVFATLQVNWRARLHRSFADYGYFRTASLAPASVALRKSHILAAQSSAIAARQSMPTLGQASAQPAGQSTPAAAGLSIDAPHSQASDAWKGLIFSLMASNRNVEALQELAKIPPDVRAQLEADVEFEQGEANLYLAVGDTAQASEYVNRVQGFYLLHRAVMPAGTEVQYAWMLYNAGDDRALYPVLQRLDARADLTAPQRDQVQTIWANYAVRRAEALIEGGSVVRGIQLLQAASENYPDNMTIRSAVAGAYAKTGRPEDALTLFKTIPMQNATAGDFQGAVNAALGATDMAQAEAWLRLALARFPNDPQILALAARFEQARGNTTRAADFWRASLAALPPGAAAAKLNQGLVPPGSYANPAPSDMKKLLDPHGDEKATTLPPLPAYGPNRSVSHTPESTQAPAPLPQSQAQPGRWTQAPSSLPLPFPGELNLAAPNGTGNALPVPGGAAAGQGIAAVAQPAPIPQSSALTKPPSQPVLVEQSAKHEAQIHPALSGSPTNSAHTGTASKSSPGAGKTSPNLAPYMGKMNLPPSEETVASTGAEPGSGRQQNAPSPAWSTNSSSGSPNPAPGLRISSQPMNPVAAQAQALFADQTDGQLTQGSAAAIHTLPNSPVGAMPSIRSGQTTISQLNPTQYTPSAQEAATGAYSAPKQQQGTSAQQPALQPQQSTPAPPQITLAKPPAAECIETVPCAAAKKPAAHKKPKPKPSGVPAGVPTLDQVPQSQPSAAQQPQVPADVPVPATAPTTETGLSDQELQQRDLPPLRGPWVRTQRQSNSVNPRDEAEMQLRSIESSYSPWIAGIGLINYRSGSLGYDHLSALEAPFEISVPLGYNARLSLVAKPVFLDSGQADGTSVITVQESTTAGSSLVQIPQPIGTLTSTATTPPAQQNAVGIGGELQLTFPHFGLAGGYSPAGFLVSTFTGRAYWKPGNGPVTLNFSRDPVRDTQLSYAGLRDPSGNSLGTEGQIWGGVTANQGQVQYAHGDAESGFYLGAGGQYLTGYTVEKNARVDGSGGAYWRLKTMPEYGNLSIGINFFGMHYTHNEDVFTHGMGGYFSPQAYFLANVPFTWAGHYNTRWHYNILGSLGVQAFQETLTPLWPLAADKALETSMNNPMLPAKTSVGPNYDVRSNVSYQIGPHWFAGGFLTANNSRNYSSISAGFSIHYMFRAQPSTATNPTGIFPTDGLRPFAVP